MLHLYTWFVQALLPAAQQAVLATVLLNPVSVTPAPIGSLPSISSKVASVVGKWTLCRSESTHTTGKGALRSSTTYATVANVCTTIVFRADGTGSAGLGDKPPYAFTWQQRARELEVTYPPASSKATRLEAGVYQVAVSVLPARDKNPSFNQLTLSNQRGTLFLLRAERSK